MTFEIKPSTDNTSITIGDSNQTPNKIGIEVTSTEDADIRVTITVQCGGKETDLLASKDARVSASYQINGQTLPMSAVTNPPPPADERVWNTGSEAIAISSSQKLSILLEKFVSNTPPGESRIAVFIETWNEDREIWLLPGEYVPEDGIPIEKISKVSQDPEIQYFTLDPDYILHAGRTQVKVRFYATDYQGENIALYRNNEPVSWKDPFDIFSRARIKPDEEQKKFLDIECGDDIDLRKQVDALLAGRSNAEASSMVRQGSGVSGYFTDYPSITSVYRLEARSEGKLSYAEKRTVQVISPGWNQVALPQGSPIRLFVVPQDLSGSGGARLYGIFMDKEDGYALYSSETGVDHWRLEEGEVPQHMATSPGVYYKGQLWLIGGSAVSSKIVSSEVWRYAVNKSKNTRSWSKATMFSSGMPVRMGHACVVYPRTLDDGMVEEEIWVMGGYNQGSVYSDVWRLKEDQGKFDWEPLSENAWTGRMNHAAATFKNADGENEVWVYGGSRKPNEDGLFDLWFTDDGGSTWKQKKTSEEDRRIVPDPGRPLGSALVAYSPTDEDNAGPGRLFLIGSFMEWADGTAGGRLGNRVSSFMFEWYAVTGVWEARPVSNGWQQFQGQNFYMQAVAYNGFIFVWSLRRNIDSTLKLNILVS